MNRPKFCELKSYRKIIVETSLPNLYRFVDSETQTEEQGKELAQEEETQTVNDGIDRITDSRTCVTRMHHKRIRQPVSERSLSTEGSRHSSGE